MTARSGRMTRRMNGGWKRKNAGKAATRSVNSRPMAPRPSPSRTPGAERKQVERAEGKQEAEADEPDPAGEERARRHHPRRDPPDQDHAESELAEAGEPGGGARPRRPIAPVEEGSGVHPRPGEQVGEG